MQADSIVRAYPTISIASIRPHACLDGHPGSLAVLSLPPDHPITPKPTNHPAAVNDCWGYVVSFCRRERTLQLVLTM